MLVRMQRKENPLTLLVGMQTGAATLENSMEVPQKVENRATLGPSNCTTGYLPQRYKCSNLKGHLHPSVYSSNVHNSQTMERDKMSINGWMEKEDVVYICTHTMEYYSAIKKNEIVPFAMTCMELECVMLSKVSQSEKDKYHMISHSYVEFKKWKLMNIREGKEK